MHHELKLWERYWDAKKDGRKPWEYRSITDRDFNEGDTVTFLKVKDYTGEPLHFSSRCTTITYVFKVDDDHVIFTHTQA